MEKVTCPEWDAHGLDSFPKGGSGELVSILVRYTDAQLYNCEDQGGICNLASHCLGLFWMCPTFPATWHTG